MNPTPPVTSTADGLPSDMNAPTPFLPRARLSTRAVGPVLWALCCGHCAVGTVLWALCCGHCAVGTVLWALCCGHCAVGTVLPARSCTTLCASGRIDFSVLSLRRAS